MKIRNCSRMEKEPNRCNFNWFSINPKKRALTMVRFRRPDSEGVMLELVRNWGIEKRKIDSLMVEWIQPYVIFHARKHPRTQTPARCDTQAHTSANTCHADGKSHRSISRVHIAASSLASSENSRSKSRTVAVNRSHDGPEITERSVRRTEPRDGSPRETDRKSRTLRRAPACCSDDFRSDLILRKTLTYAKCTG